MIAYYSDLKCEFLMFLFDFYYGKYVLRIYDIIRKRNKIKSVTSV